MYVYCCYTERRISAELGSYYCFGLAAQKLNCKDGTIKDVASLPDISLNRRFVERLARLFTEYQLDPVHLLDAVEDALE